MQLHAVNPIRGQHAARGADPIDPGNDEIRIVLEIAPQFVGGRGLKAQIQLHGDGIGQGLNHLDWFQSSQRGLAFFDPFGQPAHKIEIALKCVLHAGPQHFYGDLGPIGRHRPVHLCDRRGRNRVRIECFENVADGPVELGLDG